MENILKMLTTLNVLFAQYFDIFFYVCRIYVFTLYLSMLFVLKIYFANKNLHLVFYVL